jgi:hypothetical protein
MMAMVMMLFGFRNGWWLILPGRFSSTDLARSDYKIVSFPMLRESRMPVEQIPLGKIKAEPSNRLPAMRRQAVWPPG